MSQLHQTKCASSHYNHGHILYSTKINEALNSIYKVWLAVVATLTLEFAQTVALAMSIGHFLKKPCDRYLSPMIKNALPDKYDKWVPILLGW